MVLNKEEKRILKGYVLEALKEIQNIYFNYRDMDEYLDTEEKYDFATHTIEKITEPSEFLAMNDMYKYADIGERYLNAVIKEEYVKKTSLEEKFKRRDKKEEKIKKIKERSIQKGIEIGEEQAKCSFEDIKHEIRKKGIEEGFKYAKESCKMSEKEILNMAEKIKLERKLGFKKKEE